jgi:hypothetical protein
MDLLDEQVLKEAGCHDLAPQRDRVAALLRNLLRALRHSTETPRSKDMQLGAPNGGAWFDAA